MPGGHCSNNEVSLLATILRVAKKEEEGGQIRNPFYYSTEFQ
jgi:hypothetical protein